MRSKVAEIQIPAGLPPKKELARRIKLARISAGLTQSEVAEALYVSRWVVVRIETGVTFPDFDTVSQLAKMTGQSIDFFVV